MMSSTDPEMPPSEDDAVAALVRLIPLGPVDELSCQVVAGNLQALMDLTVDILPPRPVFPDAFMEARRQFDAVKIIKHLAERFPGPTLGLGLTGSDLGTPVLTYVLGESQLGGRMAVVSTYRLTGAGAQRKLERLVKISLHEMAHVLGLGHCWQPQCLMRSPRNVAQVDELPLAFCDTCRYEIGRRVRNLFHQIQSPPDRS
jgi:archaemetzincin